MSKLILVRHGQSQWNLENRFTGWVDVDLTEEGRQEALRAGEMMQVEGLRPDVAFTSTLKRAIRTLNIVLDVLDRQWIPVFKSWRLNERHYGSLQGLDKSETAAKYGEEQVKVWRRSYATPPPHLTLEDKAHPRWDERYKEYSPESLPKGESLKDTVARLLPYWESDIVPQLKAGKTVIVAAHGNSLRALIQHLDGMSEQAILELNIPTAIPLVYELDQNLKPLTKRYLADEATLQDAVAAVANQGKKK